MSEIQVAGRKEGKLVVYVGGGHASPAAQHAISQDFKEKYAITIEWTNLGGGTDMVPRLLAEQRTKQYVADIAMTGFGTVNAALKPRGYLQPILAPSTFEKSVWRLDPAAAVPQDRDWLFLFMALTPSFFINTTLVPSADEPKSYQDLLSPKWQGKIVLQNPAQPGTGSGWFYATYKVLGTHYLTTLAKQVVLVTGVSDSVDAVARGAYPIALSPSNSRGRQLVLEGAPVKFIHPKEGSHLATQGIHFISNAPHPNAAKLFLNWIYTREGQTLYATNHQVPSLRKDVSQDYLPAGMRYVEGRPLLVPDAEDLSAERTKELRALARKIFEGGK
jgi:iron(III) transport system substrate-binding protein